MRVRTKNEVHFEKLRRLIIEKDIPVEHSGLENGILTNRKVEKDEVIFKGKILNNPKENCSIQWRTRVGIPGSQTPDFVLMILKS